MKLLWLLFALSIFFVGKVETKEKRFNPATASQEELEEWLHSKGTGKTSDAQEGPGVKNVGTSAGFRKTTWGMTKEQVRRTEKGKVAKEESDMLVYEGSVLNLNCLILYLFTEGKLVRAKYGITEKHTNKNDYISDFGSLKKSLTKKYGKPTKDKQYWRNKLYRNDYDQRGFAVSLGHLSYFTKWEPASTNITLFLRGDNFDILLGVDYQSQQFKYLEERAKEKKAQEEL